MECRIMSDHATAADDDEIFCSLLGRNLMNSSESWQMCHMVGCMKLFERIFGSIFSGEKQNWSIQNETM
ncbi:hypothetical protein Nepgr_009803 [Nepenthes gracilis]|uniref:Uncharacterized protein n=1 Tax=Nepenthes gracilis TaxID=150966 RepID=A0AAD3XKH3_NEPGR|nr:hypothetical protein Nepgr_009803 [Nepenthes gracilis]